MTILLVLTSLILISIAVWQLTKILELSKPADYVDSEIASDKDNDMQGKLMLKLHLFTEKIMITYYGFHLPLSFLFRLLLKLYFTILHLNIEVTRKEKLYFLQIVHFWRVSGQLYQQ